LTLEHVVVYAGNDKSTTDMSAEVYHYLEEVEALAFYTAPNTKKGRGMG
jgi:hypothetical protein